MGAAAAHKAESSAGGERLLDQAALFRDAGDFRRAEGVYRRALAGDPANAELHYLTGASAFDGGNRKAAEENLTRAVLLDPAAPPSLRGLAESLRVAGREEAARAWCGRALALGPGETQAYLTRALLDPDQGEACYRAVLALKPDHASAVVSLANLQQQRGRFAEAEPLYLRNLKLRPAHAEGYKNYAVSLCLQGRLGEAEKVIRKAMRFQPEDPGHRMALGQILLLAGKLREGWKFYEWRGREQKNGGRTRNFPQPLWDGRTDPARTVLIHAEQGYGDMLQFCRYVPLAAERARIILDVPKPMAALLAGLPGVDQLVVSGDPLPPFDMHCPMMSLARVFDTGLDTIPTPIPYIAADPVRAAYWRGRLAALKGFRVGLAWTGSPGTPRDAQRSIRPDLLAGLGGVPDVHFVSLQKYQGKAPPALPATPIIHDWTAELDDFADTAALIEGLDLVISVDTSVVHLAGAMGKPVWLLNRFSPCWRWLLGRDDSPWYPTLKQYRQTVLDDWDSVLRAVAADLKTVARPTC